MNENDMLAQLAKLCGDITLKNNQNADALIQLQQTVASAIINDPALQTSSQFQFEQIENFSTHHLDAADVEDLNNILQGVKENPQTIDNTIRVFKREVPFISSQIRGSVPDWGRGGNIINIFGPFTNKDGRKFWFDFYRIIPVVQVWLQGAAQPFMLLPLEVSNRINFIAPRSYKIPKGSVWIHADVFATAAPDNLYCGLTVAGGTLSFTGPLTISAGNKLIVPNGMEATIKLNLQQKIVTDISPDDNGIDVKEATIKLPETFNISINHTGKSLEAGAASWNLYGQAINFAFDNTKPMQWSPELNRILIPYKADVAELNVLQCKSPVCTVNGKAAIALSAWALSAAAININAPLQADGTGAMAVGVLQGIEVSWLGLKDANLFEKSNTQLKNALVMLMPGRINIATLFAANITGRQRYNLWQETVNGIEKPVQYIDLQYTKQFFFFYDSLQKGTESVAAQANCNNYVDKPVQVNGMPFKVESLQTVFTLSISKALQIVMLYDDDIIKDNFLKNYKPIPGTPVPPVTFTTTAIALNNGLLAVSPVYGMLLYGDLKTEDSFDKCLLVYSFGLLHYLPTLPDPYAANISLLRRGLGGRSAFTNSNAQEPVNKYSLADINALLVCFINWQNMEAPSVNFILGDKPANALQLNAFINTENTLLKKEGFRINTLQNQELINNELRNNLTSTFAIQNKNWQAATENNEAVNAMLTNDIQAMMNVNERMSQGNISPIRNVFTLLDVSTNADLMGVSLGFSNDQFVFEQTHVVQQGASPISIIGMDVHATSRLVQMYALPQISWEPVINITTEITNVATDPFPGLLYFLNDGVPAQIANIGNKPVAIAPIPLSKKLTEWYKTEPDFAAWSFFTLPYGMLALAKYQKQLNGNNPKLELIEKKFPNDLHTGLQIKTVGLNDPINKNKKFFGSAHQLSNTYNLFFPATGARSMLSGSVTEIFNDEFGTLIGFDLTKYVPLERYDFSGYGANVFSHWVNENAALAQTSQAMFDVWRGRTAHEVIQVKSVVYPWGIRVVRTITIYRGSNGFPWRVDSGWKAESDGIYDFRSPLKDTGGLAAAIAEENSHTYKFHPGVVEGVFNVRNIKEDTTLAPFAKPWNKDYGVFIDNQGHAKAVPNPGGQPLNIKLTPVYFDADVQIDDVTQGASNGKVVSQRMLGYLQLSPRGVFVDEESFTELLTLMNGLGGPVDCMVKINQTKQQMRITRVEVNPSMNEPNKRVFVAAAKGTPVLPKDGSWSVVQHDAASKEVTPLSNNDVIPLIRKGFRDFQPGTLNYVQDKLTHPLNIAESTELFKDLESRVKQFGFLQSTGENKVLFRNPLFEKGKNLLKGSIPDLADAYRLMNSKGIFPKLENLPKIDEIGDALNKFGVNIIDEGYKLLNNTVADAEKKLVQLLPPGPWYIVNTNDVKVYIEYKPTKPNPADNPPGGKAQLDFDIDSKAREWVNKMNDITMVVDLVSFKRLVLIRGKFDTKKGQSPSFIGPELEFGPDLKPVVDILVLLSMIATDASYTDILKKGLKIAMSNSPNNWEYKFQADKEIPVLKFPPPLLDTAAAPLRLEAGLKVGVFFNVAIPLPPTNGIPMPSAGAFVEFYGKLSVMCVSVGVGTIYAVGQVTVRISADTVKGPALYMKFGFGVEAVVALPVIGSVSVYFAVGVEMSLDSTQITIGAFVLFKGRAEILGGIVTVTIQIEASGKVQKRIGGPSGETNMIAQVTFSLDISICFIINISFSESWQEQRQIA
jgi:hypothetical protein